MEAQVKQGVAATATQNKIDVLETSMQQILNLLKNNTVPTTTETPAHQHSYEGSPTPAERALALDSPAPSAQSNEHYNYKPKVKDPLRFSNKDGLIQYHS
jgi:hypothetical protein